MNIFLVMSALGLSRDDGMQIALFDLHPDGPYSQFLTQVYAPKHPIIRAANFGDKKILFRRLIFHLESPAGLIFPKVTLPDPNRCWGPSLFQAYRRHVLHSLDLWDVTPPPIPTVTLTLRHRTPEVKMNVHLLLYVYYNEFLVSQKRYSLVFYFYFMDSMLINFYFIPFIHTYL